MSKSIGRRQFLHLMLVSGLSIGCRPRQSPDDPAPTSTLFPTPLIITATPPVTLAVERRFQLEDEAISYHPNPAGCEITSIHGTVKDEDGQGLAGMTILVREGDDPTALTLTTDQDGQFSVDVAQELTDRTYKIQVVADEGRIQLSDVVVAQALPDCSLNLIDVHFVPLPA